MSRAPVTAHLVAAAAAAALVVTVGATAGADIGPGPDDTSSCTESRREQPGVDCEECAEEQCDSRFEGTDYEYVCSREDWDDLVEVWCNGDPREVFSAAGGCRMTDPSERAPLGAGLFGAALVLVVWLVRSRPGH